MIRNTSLSLQEIGVVDSAPPFAGPVMATILGDYGVGVIKVEHPAGYTLRSLGWQKDGIRGAPQSRAPEDTKRHSPFNWDHRRDPLVLTCAPLQQSRGLANQARLHGRPARRIVAEKRDLPRMIESSATVTHIRPELRAGHRLVKHVRGGWSS